MKALVLSIVFIIALTYVSFGQVSDSISKTVTEQKTSEKVIVYGSDTCHYCIDTKAYLKEKKIDFIYYDVDVNLLKQREMLVKLQKAGVPVDNLSLPVVDLNGKLVMNGSNFEDFLKKLGASKKLK
ncbi:glutaredoxin family protein [Aestuariivivens insulae]|uniref:glutaredoxin family protein n=1 Tax=Aestuariivivens insulae TaxID=1621988 RepID=UPI001F58BBA3|nr:glutaredoxin family protein [Aestuariivivens insulae]